MWLTPPLPKMSGNGECGAPPLPDLHPLFNEVCHGAWDCWTGRESHWAASGSCISRVLRGAQLEACADPSFALQRKTHTKSRTSRQFTNQPVNQSTNRPIDQSTSQAVNHSTNNRSTNRLVNLSPTHPLNQSTSQPVNQSTSQPVNQSTNHSINHSTTQPLNHSTTQPLNHSTTQPVDQSTSRPVDQLTNRPINQSTSQPVDQANSQPINQCRLQFRLDASRACAVGCVFNSLIATTSCLRLVKVNSSS